MFAVCRNQFHWPQNDRKGLKLVSKMALKKWNMNFCLEYSTWKNSTTVFRCSFAPRNFPQERPKKVVFIYSLLLKTQTLNNSNVMLTRTNVNFPWISFLHLLYFTLGKSNPRQLETPANSK